MFRALARVLATRTGMLATVVCVAALVVAALLWPPGTEAPVTADRPSTVPGTTAPAASPRSAPEPFPSIRAGEAARAEPERPRASRTTGAARPVREMVGLTVRSILVGADRRLALVDGRIVGAGDRVGGAVVVAIAPHAVELRDAGGGRRTLELARPAPGAELR